MKIGYDAKRIVRNGTGLGSYGRTLINALSASEPELNLYLYAPDRGREELRNQIQMRENVQMIFAEHLHWRLQKDYWRTRGIVKELVNDGIDLFHGLSGELPSGLRRADIRSVVTIHDLIFLRHPEYYNRIDVMIYAHKFRRTCREADRIIAISECTKRDILAFSDFPEERIDVVYQSCGLRFGEPANDESLSAVRRKYHLPSRYVLNVGTIEERKNVLQAVMALEKLPTDVSLVVVGRSTNYAQRVLKYASRHGLSERVRMIHGLSDEELPCIYQMAEAFVYPSRYEGFGIPIIEAIQSGLPAAACTGSCLEEAGGPDCLYVDPDDANGLAAAIGQLLKGSAGREERIARSRDYVRRFENADVARQIKAVYEKLQPTVGEHDYRQPNISR